MSFSTGVAFNLIDGGGVRPCPLVDATGAPLTLDPSQAIYVELRCHDVGDVPKTQLVAGRRYDLDLQKQITKDQCTLYRSQPLVCHLEAPHAYGVQVFASASGCLPVWVLPPYTIYAQIAPTTFGGPQEHRTPTRPLANLTVCDRFKLQGRLDAAIPLTDSFAHNHGVRPARRAS